MKASTRIRAGSYENFGILLEVLGFPKRVAEGRAEHVGRVAGLLSRSSDSLRPKMGAVAAAVEAGHDTVDEELLAELTSAVHAIEHALRTDGHIQGLSKRKQAALLVDRIMAASEGNTPNDWKCVGLSYPDGRPFDSDDARTPQAMAAKLICQTCVMRAECLEQALNGAEPANIWGGYTAGERHRMKKR